MDRQQQALRYVGWLDAILEEFSLSYSRHQSRPDFDVFKNESDFPFEDEDNDSRYWNDDEHIEEWLDRRDRARDMQKS